MAAPSVRVENRLHNANQVIRSAELHGSRVAPLLADLLEDTDEAEAKKLLGSLARTLKAATLHLEKAEAAYVQEQADDPQKRDVRDKLASEGAKGLQMVRSTLNSVQPDGGLLRSFGVPRQIPTKPATLQGALASAAALLQKSGETYSNPLGLKIVAKELGNFLADLANKLDKAIEEVKQEETELLATLMDRDRAMDQWDHTYLHVARSLESLYRLAGLQELANRIRPTIEKRRGEIAPDAPIEDTTLSVPSNTTNETPSPSDPVQ